MEMFHYELRVPKDRVAVLIGKDGKIKEEIEENTKTKLEIDSKEGDVSLSGKDALGLYSAREVVRAIGRGFNPEVAMLLLKSDYCFDSIDLSEFVGSSKEHLTRVKGRIIGEGGKCRRIIEEMTESYVVVYGKTVAVIGLADSVSIARAAIDMLASGSPHSAVYKMLEKKRRDLKRDRLLENFSRE